MSETSPLISFESGRNMLVQASPHMITDPQTVSVRLGDNWAHEVEDKTNEETVDAYVELRESGSVLRLTKGSILGLAKAVSVSKDLLISTPPSLLEPVLNYWLSTAEGDAGPRFTVTEAGVATAVVRPSATLPLTTYQVASTILASVCDQDESAAQFVSSSFDLRHVRTTFTMAFPETAANGWLGAIFVAMSDSGHVSPTISPALVRESDGLVIIPTSAAESKYSVRKHGKSLDSVVGWVEAASGVISVDLPDLRKSFEASADIDISEDLEAVVQDVFAVANLPLSLQAHALDEIEVAESLGAGLDLALIVADLQKWPDERPERVERIYRAAGTVLTALGSRCPSCSRLRGSHAH